jgi:type I restriction enzyme M protein
MNESRETSGVVFVRDLWKRVIPDVEADSKCKGQPKPDAWIDHDKTKIGYEIPFNRHFYVFKPPRALAEIDAELKGVTDRIVKMIGELSQ